MTTDDEIIKRELAKLEKLVVPSGVHSSGAAWAASKLPTKTTREVITVSQPAVTSLESVYKVVKKLGTIIDSAHEGKFPKLKAIIGSGFFNLNPTIVTIEIRPKQKEQTDLYIEASAKEGLIPQHSAEKAIQRIKQELKS